ncbi:hypothetical protein FB45DRAFT_224788 [Roridomyces roridus]|uniref:Uncharacterized protein n=1 Tax=Roridomyces roridus TaxID=1738132 RepID=A0AAD7FDH2_9AGAR|nr:hypothetical protein FB45DRAFT_224788 [Roridomyces roridus]
MATEGETIFVCSSYNNSKASVLAPPLSFPHTPVRGRPSALPSVRSTPAHRVEATASPRSRVRVSPTSGLASMITPIIPNIHWSSSDEELARRVDVLSGQVVSMHGQLSLILPLLKTIADAIPRLTNPSPVPHGTGPNLPIWFADAYMKGSAAERIADKSAVLTRKQLEFPNIKYWNSRDYNPANDASVPSEKTSAAAGATNRENDVNTNARYIELRTGKVVGGIELGNIREDIRNLLKDLVHTGLVTKSWKRVGEQVRVALAYMIEQKYSFLGLCINHWKTLRQIKEVYRGWARNQPELTGEASDGEDSDGGSKKRKKRGGKSGSDKRARTGTALLTIPQNGPLDLPLPPAAPVDDRVGGDIQGGLSLPPPPSLPLTGTAGAQTPGPPHPPAAAALNVGGDVQ